MDQLKHSYRYSFLSQNYSPKKLTSRHNEQPNTFTRQEYKGKFMSRILEKMYVGSEVESGSEPESESETNRKVGSGSEKNHSGSTTLNFAFAGDHSTTVCPRSGGRHKFKCWIRFRINSQAKTIQQKQPPVTPVPW
jgi:hypothetical protein